ncbi:MAG: NUDIX domain-containing protein [Algoriphagus sp.]
MSEDKIRKEIESKFGNRLRVRVNGILIEDDKILLIKHQMSASSFFWSTPGGGMSYGSSLEDNLKREFLEETGLSIEPIRFLGLSEYLSPPLHALECFYSVKKMKGNAILGIDPELPSECQIIREIKWMTLKEIHSLEKNSFHQIFLGIKSLSELVLYKGYFNFENNSIK